MGAALATTASAQVSDRSDRSLEPPLTAEDREHWSFEPLATSVPPPVQARCWPATSIDCFVLAGCERPGAGSVAAG